MLQIILKRFLCLSLAVGMSPVFAQMTSKGREAGSKGPRKQITTIVFAGLAGAVLGLSTLSFYGRPQDKLSNIAVGFAVGVIGGTAFTTFQAATNPREFYNRNEYPGTQDIAFADRSSAQTLGLLDTARPSLAASPVFSLSFVF